MAIRKTGAVTGQVTGVEQAPEEAITATASAAGPAPQWAVHDEAALLTENEEADRG